MSSELLQAIEQGDLEAAIAALDAGASIDEADIHGYPGLPLRIACFKGHNAIIGELLRRGADIDGANSDGPGAPLRLASRGKQPATIRLLLERGAKKVPGLDMLLSQEEISRAQIIAEFNQQIVFPTSASDGPHADDEPHELQLQPVQFEALFGKFFQAPESTGSADLPGNPARAR